MSEWIKTRVWSISKVKWGYAFKSTDYKENWIPLVRISNVWKWYFDYKDLVYISQEKYDEMCDFKINEWDILIWMTWDLWKICIVWKENLPAILNQRVWNFITNKIIYKQLLYYIITSEEFLNELSKYFVWWAQANISSSQLESLEISFPESIKEQEKIAEILIKIDESIKKTEKIISKQERIKKWLMQDLLTKWIDENWNIRSEKTHKFKDSELWIIPEDWDCKTTLSQLYMKWRIWWQWLKANEFLESWHYLVTWVHFNKNNWVDWNKCYRISDFRYEQAPEIQLKIWDILITKDGTIWKLAYIDYLPWKASLNSHLLVLRPLYDNLIPKYVLYLLLTDEFKIFIDNIKTWSTIAWLTQQNFWKYLLRIPKKEEQEKIVQILEKQDEIIKKEKNQLEKLQRLKKWLMQDLLNWKVKVTNLITN